MAGRFRLVRPLGEGGMGSVWVAWHEALGSEVAIKFIEFGAGNRDDLLARFSREAMAVAKVKSSHVVGVVDYGVDEQLGRPFLVMELLEGESLGARVERGPLPVREAVEIVRQICRGLGKAHQAGIVHRDIKPDNIFLCPEEDAFVAKLLDFGVAKTSGPLGASQGQTSTGALLGTPLYMSPEQALGTKVVDARSDLYSLTVVAYHALCGRPPFMSPGLGELIMFITSQQPPAPRTFRPELPPALEAWLLRGLDKDPLRRFQTAREMGDELIAAFNGAEPSVPMMMDEPTHNRPRPSLSGTVVMDTGAGVRPRSDSLPDRPSAAGAPPRQPSSSDLGEAGARPSAPEPAPARPQAAPAQAPGTDLQISSYMAQIKADEQQSSATLSGTSKPEAGGSDGGAKKRLLIAALVLVPALGLAAAAVLKSKGGDEGHAAQGLVASAAPALASAPEAPTATQPAVTPIAAPTPSASAPPAPASATTTATHKPLPPGPTTIKVPGPLPGAGPIKTGTKTPPPPPTSTW